MTISRKKIFLSFVIMGIVGGGVAYPTLFWLGDWLGEVFVWGPFVQTIPVGLLFFAVLKVGLKMSGLNESLELERKRSLLALAIVVGCFFLADLIALSYALDEGPFTPSLGSIVYTLLSLGYILSLRVVFRKWHRSAVAVVVSSVVISSTLFFFAMNVVVTFLIPLQFGIAVGCAGWWGSSLVTFGNSSHSLK